MNENEYEDVTLEWAIDTILKEMLKEGKIWPENKEWMRLKMLGQEAGPIPRIGSPGTQEGG